MKKNRLRIQFSCLLILITGIALHSYTYAQTPMTIEQALDIAEENNPPMSEQNR